MMYYGTEMSALNFGVKRSQFGSWWNNICWNHHCAGGGIQYSTSRVKLDFLISCLLQFLLIRLFCKADVTLIYPKPLLCGLNYQSVISCYFQWQKTRLFINSFRLIARDWLHQPRFRMAYVMNVVLMSFGDRKLMFNHFPLLPHHSQIWLLSFLVKCIFWLLVFVVFFEIWLLLCLPFLMMSAIVCTLKPLPRLSNVGRFKSLQFKLLI